MLFRFSLNLFLNEIAYILMRDFIKANLISSLKLLLLSISSIIIIFGWIYRDPKVSLPGSLLYSLALLFDLNYAIKEAKKYRDGKPIEKTNKTTIEILSQILQGLICVAALVVFIRQDQYTIDSAGIIWIGTIAIYYIIGEVARNIANIPLKMGRGGWYISRYKRKRKSK